LLGLTLILDKYFGSFDTKLNHLTLGTSINILTVTGHNSQSCLLTLDK
jgi:hypothetical protein